MSRSVRQTYANGNHGAFRLWFFDQPASRVAQIKLTHAGNHDNLYAQLNHAAGHELL